MRSLVAVLTVSVLSAATAWSADADAKAGRTAYEKECRDCHAMNGAPVSSVAKAMRKQQVEMRSLASKEVQAQSDAEWRKMVIEGIGRMKPVKSLSGPGIDDVIAYMRGLKKK